LFAEFDGTNYWDAVRAASPASNIGVSDQELDHTLHTVGNFADVKSPYTIGYSRRVAGPVEEGARACSISHDDITAIRWT